MADIGNSRVREMTEEDRLSLLHLSRQVEAIATQLEGLSDATGGSPAQNAPLRAHAASDGAITAMRTWAIPMRFLRRGPMPLALHCLTLGW